MNNDKDEILLHDYFDNLLSSAEQEEFEDYLLDNIDLAIELGRLKNLQRNLKNLSSNFTPPDSVIENIINSLLEGGKPEENFDENVTANNLEVEKKIKEKKEAKEKRKLKPRTKIRLKKLVFFFIFMMFLSALGYGYYFFDKGNRTTPWKVTLVSTNNTLANQTLETNGLEINSILSTSDNETIQIQIADKGNVDLFENSKIQVNSGTQSLNAIKYYSGNLTFIPEVNNESFNIIFENIIIESRNSKFSVKQNENIISVNILSNYITISFKDVECKIPSNHKFKIINRNQISVPVNKHSSNRFHRLISSYAISKNEVVLDKIIRTSTSKEVFTLHFLLTQVTPVYRELLIEKLQKLVPLPSSVNKVKILFLEQSALDSWWEEIYLSQD